MALEPSISEITWSVVIVQEEKPRPQNEAEAVTQQISDEQMTIFCLLRLNPGSDEDYNSLFVIGAVVLTTKKSCSWSTTASSDLGQDNFSWGRLHNQ